jgi:FAD-dependent oxidoreductase domain-containing protein 1
MTQTHQDVVIIGGGIMGSATAYSLMRTDRRLKVTVVEKDPTYSRASTALSMANARIQFSLRQNIQISRYAFEILETFEDEMTVGEKRPNIAYRREGNLFLVDGKGRASAKAAVQLQKQLGCQIEWWTPEKIKSRYPLYETAGFAGGSFGPLDGHFDAYAVLMGYKAKAMSMGARYLEDEVVEIAASHRRCEEVRLASGSRLKAGAIVNCAGAWASIIAKTAGIDLPVEPVKRQVFVLNTAAKPDKPLPLTILPSGLYFRTETGGLLLLGKSMDDDPVGFDFTWDDKRFTEILWPELAEFVPAFDTLKLMRGWAGLYAVNRLDGNAILGEWPGKKGLFLANGFSGHGLQQAPAAGRYLTELLTGVKPTLDLSLFSPERILENRPITEKGLV